MSTTILRQRSLRVGATESNNSRYCSRPAAADMNYTLSPQPLHHPNSNTFHTPYYTSSDGYNTRTACKQRQTSALKFSWASGYGGVLNQCMLAFGVLLVAAPWIHHSSLSWQVKMTKEKIEDLQKEYMMVAQELESSLSDLKKMKSKSNRLDDENSAILHLLDQQGNFNVPSYREAAHQEDAFKLRIEAVESEIKRLSRSHTQEKYGSYSKIRARVILKEDVLKGSIVHEIKSNIKGDAFTIEMLPIDLFPHAADVFLQLVSERFYDNKILFHRDAASSILQIHRMTSDDKYLKYPLFDEKLITQAKTQQLAFIEKPQQLNENAKLRREKYSVCFRDKGPILYIIMSNEINKDEVDEKEVCFGTVKDGRAVLEFIMRTNNKKNSSKKLQTIGIESIQIIEPKNAPLGQGTMK